MDSRAQGSQKRHARLACLQCRKKKIRCDNGHPKCSNCQLYNTDCVLGEDKRRAQSTKKTINELTDRLAEVEARLAQTSQDESISQRPSIIDRSTPPDPLIEHFLDAGEELNSSATVTGPYVTTMPECSSSTPMVFRDIDLDFWEHVDDTRADLAEFSDLGPSSNMETVYEAGVESMSTLLENVGPEQPLSRISPIASQASRKDKSMSPNQSPGSGPNYNATSFDQASQTSEDDITQQISKRLGRMCLTEDGHMRYFGATSHLSMLPNDLRTIYRPDMRVFREEGEIVVKRAHLGWTPDPEYELHLTRLYFAWHNTFVSEVEKENYFQQKELYYSGYETALFSPALENAVLAIGALYSTRRHPAIQDSASDFFGARTRLYLETEMDRPTIATTQAAVILSAFESANGHDSRGWIYSGVAVQMTTDLGLQLRLDTNDDYLGSEDNTRSLEDVRRSLFWTVYSADMYHSSYSGRPYLMNRMRYDAPGLDALNDGDWQPFHSDGEAMKLPAAFDGSGIGSVTAYVVQMAIKLRKIYDTLYCGTASGSEDARLFVPAMAKQLQHWLTVLPPALRVDYGEERPSPVPAPIVLQLHILYHQILIILNRPFVVHESDSEILAGENCTKSAGIICQLLQVFKANYGLRYINVQAVASTVTAGVVHAYDSCIYSGPKGKAAQHNFVVCIQALAEIGQSFRSSIHGLEVITSLRRAWQHQMFKETRAKRRWRGSSEIGGDHLHRTPT
ncbi:Fungal Zn2-Cys6 binuclear cluster domain-containing protein [Cladophialophora immunda]|nr:Fungal Zn2-Cys6 binuclear cluster domain-containing protein [Cladophialophora immunda]